MWRCSTESNIWIWLIQLFPPSVAPVTSNGTPLFVCFSMNIILFHAFSHMNERSNSTVWGASWYPQWCDKQSRQNEARASSVSSLPRQRASRCHLLLGWRQIYLNAPQAWWTAVNGHKCVSKSASGEKTWHSWNKILNFQLLKITTFCIVPPTPHPGLLNLHCFISSMRRLGTLKASETVGNQKRDCETSLSKKTGEGCEVY